MREPRQGRAHEVANASPVGKGMSRREFIGVVSAAALTAGLPLELRAAERKMARVVLVRNEHVLDSSGRRDPAVIQRMLDTAMTELFGVEKPVDAWKRIAGADDEVGIKSNEWAHLPTPPELEAAIRQRLVDAGVDAGRITVNDRQARTVLRDSTVLVNVRPLRTHHWSGIGGCIKNPIMFVKYPPLYHKDMCADLARLWKLPAIDGKIRLNILDVLTPQFFHRGPHHFDPRFTWTYGGILVSQDPVAADAVGVRLLEAQREIHFGERRPLTELAKHVRLADERHGLGVGDLGRIELVKLGWDKDILL